MLELYSKNAVASVQKFEKENVMQMWMKLFKTIVYEIAIDLTPLYGRKRTGVEMYAIDLYRALLTSGNLIIPIFHVQNELDDNPNAVIIPESNRLLLENIKLSKCIRKIAPDIVLFPIFLLRLI